MKYDACVRHGVDARDRDAQQSWSLRLGPTFFFLCNRETGYPIQPTLDFLADRFVRKNRLGTLKFSSATRSGYVYDLAAFHWFLDQRGMRIADIRPIDLSEYLDTFTSQLSPATGRPYARATLIRHRNSVITFVSWLDRSGYLRNTDGLDAFLDAAQEPRISERPLTHFISTDGRLPKIEPVDRVIRAPDPRVLRGLMQELGPDPVDLKEDQSLLITKEQSAARLMAEIALNSGLRRAEVCSLHTEQFEIMEMDRKKDLGATAIRVVGKGAKTRDVPVPNWLIKAVQKYIGTKRKKICECAAEKSSDFRPPNEVFLNANPKANVLGTAITPRQLNRMFATARARLTEELAKDAQQPELLGAMQQSLVTFHSLRHAFAITTFHNRRLLGDPDPAKFVQSVLGHAKRETTERMYLRASHVMESELSEFWEEVAGGMIHV